MGAAKEKLNAKNNNKRKQLIFFMVRLKLFLRDPKFNQYCIA